MKAVCIVLASFLLLPSTILAANFAKQSIFLSTNAPVEGETLVIHAIVSNDSNTKFSGTLKVHEADSSIGTVAVSLDAQGAYVASVSWKPDAGSHTITGTLEEADGTKVAEESETFTIAAKKDATAATSSNEVESSKEIKDKIAGFSPALANATTPIFNAVDSLRNKAASALDAGSDWTSKKSSSEEQKGLVAAAVHMGATILWYLFMVLTYLVVHAALFYPVLALAFLYALWRLYKRMRRPSFS